MQTTEQCTTFIFLAVIDLQEYYEIMKKADTVWGWAKYLNI